MQEYLTEGKLDALHDYLDTYNESLQKMFRAEQALYDTYERILNNFGLAE